MLSGLLKAIGQFSDPRMRRVVWMTLGLSLAVLAALAAGLWLGIAALNDTTLPWLHSLIEVAAGLGVVILSWFLFPAAVSVVIGFFLEDVTAAVEARHYPALPPAREQPLREAILGGVRFAGRALLVNLAALPIILIASFLPPLNLVVFYGLNGYLLSREYFELVALRRLDERQARQLRRAFRARIYVAGVVVAVLLTIPLVNLVAPVVATAFMLHLFEEVRTRAWRV